MACPFIEDPVDEEASLICRELHLHGDRILRPRAGAREGVLCRGCCGGGGGDSQFLRINITPNSNRKSCYSLRTFMRSC